MSLKKKLTALAVVIGVVALAGIGYAYWTSTGTGSGSATTGTSSAWQVTTSPAVGDPLTPDGPTQDVGIHVTNNNSGVQRLESLDVAVKNADGSTWDPAGACSAADFKIGDAAPGTTYTVSAINDSLASGATHDTTATIQMVDTGANQDTCKSVSVPLYVSAK